MDSHAHKECTVGARNASLTGGVAAKGAVGVVAALTPVQPGEGCATGC